MLPKKENAIVPAAIMRNVYAAYSAFAMLAGMQLDVFTPLKDGPMSAEALAQSLGVKAEMLSPLLYALVTAGLLTVEEGCFANTEEADKFLVCGRPEYMGGSSGFYSKLWQATLCTAESIRSGHPQAKQDWKSLPQAELVQYFESQYPGSLRAGRQLAEKIDFSAFNHLLDAGGGTGGLSIGLCGAYPELLATVADFPNVVRICEGFISKAGMSHRIKATASDLVAEPPAGVYDVAVLRALLQVMSPDKARKVLSNVSKALEPGGSLHIIGCVLDDSRLSPLASVAFGLVFLNVYEDSHAYTESDHVDWLREAGFREVSIEHEVFFDGLSIVSARKA